MCVPEEGAGTAKNVPALGLGSVFEVILIEAYLVRRGACVFLYEDSDLESKIFRYRLMKLD